MSLEISSGSDAFEYDEGHLACHPPVGIAKFEVQNPRAWEQSLKNRVAKGKS